MRDIISNGQKQVVFWVWTGAAIKPFVPKKKGLEYGVHAVISLVNCSFGSYLDSLFANRSLFHRSMVSSLISSRQYAFTFHFASFLFFYSLDLPLLFSWFVVSQKAEEIVRPNDAEHLHSVQQPRGDGDDQRRGRAVGLCERRPGLAGCEVE